MEWIEITAKSVAGAVEAALDELGVDETDLEYEVLEEPRKGLFGRLSGGSTARIRARVKPISREKPDRRRRRPGPRAEGSRGDGERSEGRRSEGGRSEGGRSEGGRSGPPRERRPARTAPDAGPAAAEKAAPGGDDSAARSDPTRKRNRSRGRSGDRRPEGADSYGSPVQNPTYTNSEENDVTGSVVSLDEQVDLAETFTRGLVERFGLPAEVTARADGDDDVVVDVAGDDLGLLIGPRATTLDAVQELVRTMVQRRIGGYGARVHVDVSGYRARRQAALAEFTRQAAERALDSGRDQVFEPMSAADRKVVHDTVTDIDGVETFSEGEDPRRRVVIKVS